MSRHVKWWAVAALCLYAATPSFAVPRENPFSDVPQRHWAYSAVRDAVRSGILQGYNGKFHGNKPLTRYQMAQVVQRMLRMMYGKRPGDKLGMGTVTEQDLRNLEALTIEFADELALLNVKVSTLEDNVAGLKHDVEALKGAQPGWKPHKPEKRAGISGMVALRTVATDGGGPTGGAGPAARFAAGTATAAGTPRRPLVRYQGNAPVAGTFESRTFFTVPQLSIAYDREIDHGLRIHAQFDYDADFSSTVNGTGTGTAALGTFSASGTNIQINEAWMESEDVVGGWGAKLGAFALPFSDEHNGRFRTLDWTVTPTAQTARYEMWRPIGLELFTNDSLFSFDLRGGVLSGLDNQNAALFANEFALAGFSGTPFTDVPWGVQTGGGIGLAGGALAATNDRSEVKDFGFYARIGDHPNEGGLGWDINYIMNGDIAPAATEEATPFEFQALSGTIDYFWPRFALVAQIYKGVTKNSATGGTAGGGAGISAAPVGIYNVAADTESSSIYALANYRWDPDNNFTVRYETAEDDTVGHSLFKVDTLTVAWNRIISDHSLLQFEYMNPDGKFTSRVAGGANNTVDVNDQMLQANYKLIF